MNRKLLAFCIGILLACIARAQTAIITASATSGCAPFTVTFGGGPNGAASYSWNFDNGNTSNLQNPGPQIYLTPGSYTVTLSVNGGPATSQVITVNSTPVVNFYASDTSGTGCFPLSETFTSTSTVASGTITQYDWDFGDGNTSTQPNPTHIYTMGNAVGFPVTLKVTSSNGCSNTGEKTKYIVIINGVTANFNYNASSGCKIPTTVNFNSISTGPGTLTYSWTFGNGGAAGNVTSASTTYSSAGTFSAALTVSSSAGCTATDTQNIVITGGNEQSSFSAVDSACVGGTVTFQNTSNPPPSVATWDFGDGATATGQVVTHTYTSPAIYAVKLVNIFGGCNDSITNNLTVLSPPIAKFKADDTVTCSNSLTVNFTDQSTNATSWSWNFGDGSTSNAQSPSHTFSGYGSYPVTLVVSNSTGCSGSTNTPINIYLVQPSVQILGLPLNGCAPFALSPTFQDSLVGGISSYNWNFGDGTTSNVANPPPHSYPAGSYLLTLTLTGVNGCTATTSDSVRVGTTKPTAAFTAAPIPQCLNQPVNFTDQSSGGVTQWVWDFGDLSGSTSQDPSHIYTTPGTFTIKEVVYNNGCGDTLIKSNYVVVNLPKADFTYTSVCSAAGLQFTFIDKSQGATSWNWNFGDGTTSPLQNPPVHTFSGGPSSYNVTLTVTDAATGCQDVKATTITTSVEKANFAIGPNPACVNTGVYLSTINVADSNIATYTWEYGTPLAPPSVGAHFNSTHLAYTTPGTYTITLILQNKNGCIDSSSQQVVVNGPIVNFSANAPGGCTSLAAVFTDLSTDASAPIVKWTWDFGDGSPLQSDKAPPFMHNYTTQGIFSVTLTATDANGCLDSTTKPNLIAISYPRAIFSEADSLTCPASSVTFINGSSGYGLTYAWNFGDGSNSTAQNPPAHSYPVGTFPVGLTVTDQYGCVDSISHTIISDTPHASFNLSATMANCPPLIDTFTFTGSYYQSVEWHFGDGGTSNLINPIHFYTIPGTYFDTLVVTSHGGCTETAVSPPIQVFGPYGALTYSPLEGCHTLPVNFSVSTTTAVIKYVWEFAPGIPNATLSTTVPNASYTYDSVGKYVPLVVLTDVNNCSVPVFGTDTIVIAGSQPGFGNTASVFCNNGSVTFNDTTHSIYPITNYLWDFGDGSTANTPDTTHFYGTPGLYTVKLFTTTMGNCVDSAVRTNLVKIVANPSVDINGVNYTLCEPATQVFTAVEVIPDTSNINWFWNFYNGNLATGASPPEQVYQAGSDSVMLVAMNSTGCVDTVKKYFTTYPLPQTNAGPDTAVCVGRSVTLQGSGAASYTWASPDNTLSCFNCQDPVSTPDTTTTYVLTGYTPFGCSKSDSVVVNVVMPHHVSVGSAVDSICIGQSVQLMANGETSFTWSPATGLNNSNIADPIASPSTTTLYQVIGTDYKSCFADTEAVEVKVFNYPTVDPGPNVTIAPGSSYQIKATGSSDIDAVAWNPPAGLSCSNCLTPVAAPISTTTYVVSATNNGGCTTSDSITIHVLCSGGNLFVPNTFSPNNDGMNDVFYVRGTGLTRVQSMLIFNRWGQVVFERKDFTANDPAAGWDGTINGKPAPVDVYVYTIEVICTNSQIVPFHGNVALIR
ncbi:MAG TPA: PKD domain-containing protein [Puia sp.]|nr:PKD domain-containing protein [Puia sp.]